MKKLLKNCQLADGTIADILIADGKIAACQMGIKDAHAKTTDCTGLTALPGLVDMHCHLREPGYEYKEDIESGTRAAAAGGFTAVACMANTMPINDNKTVTVYIKTRAKEAGMTRVYPIAAVSKGMRGDVLTDMLELKKFGAVAVSDDGKPINDAMFMKNAMIYANMAGMTLISHCEEMSLAGDGCMNEGATASESGLRGIPSAAESVMAARDILLAEYTDTPVHLAHVSARQTIQIVREAKKRGVKVTCETCPHYFALTDAACAEFDGAARVNPPLRSEDDRLAVIDGIVDGTIDAIVTDHAPHHVDEKKVEFEAAANGISGFETAFAVANTYLVKPGYITLARLSELMTTNPAKILGVSSCGLKEGDPADVLLADLSEKWTVDPEKFLSRGKNTPFKGMSMTGRIKSTIVNGEKVF